MYTYQEQHNISYSSVKCQFGAPPLLNRHFGSVWFGPNEECDSSSQSPQGGATGASPVTAARFRFFVLGSQRLTVHILHAPRELEPHSQLLPAPTVGKCGELCAHAVVPWKLCMMSWRTCIRDSSVMIFS